MRALALAALLPLAACESTSSFTRLDASIRRPPTPEFVFYDTPVRLEGGVALPLRAEPPAEEAPEIQADQPSGSRRLIAAPAVTRPGHPVERPGEAVGLPGMALSRPGHSVGLPGTAVSRPGRAVDLPAHPVCPPDHPVGLPGEAVTAPEHPLDLPAAPVARTYSVLERPSHPIQRAAPARSLAHAPRVRTGRGSGGSSLGGVKSDPPRPGVRWERHRWT